MKAVYFFFFFFLAWSPAACELLIGGGEARGVTSTEKYMQKKACTTHKLDEDIKYLRRDRDQLGMVGGEGTYVARLPMNAENASRPISYDESSKPSFFKKTLFFKLI